MKIAGALSAAEGRTTTSEDFTGLLKSTMKEAPGGGMGRNGSPNRLNDMGAERSPRSPMTPPADLDTQADQLRLKEGDRTAQYRFDVPETAGCALDDHLRNAAKSALAPSRLPPRYGAR